MGIESMEALKTELLPPNQETLPHFSPNGRKPWSTIVLMSLMKSMFVET